MKKAKRKDLPLVDHEKIDYESFRRNFYIEAEEIKNMTAEEVAIYRGELEGIKIRVRLALYWSLFSTRSRRAIRTGHRLSEPDQDVGAVRLERENVRSRQSRYSTHTPAVSPVWILSSGTISRRRRRFRRRRFRPS